MVVLGGESDLFPASTGHRHVAGDDVDLAVLEDGDAVRGGDDPQLDLVLVAEDGCRDGLGDVDVEALDDPGLRVAGAEQEGVRGGADDEPAAVLDGGAMTLLTIQYNLCAGTIARYSRRRPELVPLVEDLLQYRKQCVHLSVLLSTLTRLMF